MSIGKDSRCKACQSPHRADLDQRLLAGDSARTVATWLKDTHGQAIPFQAIANHKTKHLAVLTEAKARIEAKVEVMREQAVEKVVADVELLDEVAGAGIRVVRQFDRLLREPGNAEAMGMEQVALFTSCMREVRQAVEARNDILNGKKVDVNGLDGLAGLLALGFDQPGSGAAQAVGEGPGALQPGGAGAGGVEPPSGSPPGGGEPPPRGGP